MSVNTADLSSGLTSEEARALLAHVGPNALQPPRRAPMLRLLLRQFLSPIVCILVAATVLSAVLGDIVDSVIIVAIIAASGLLSFFQERGASKQMTQLLLSVKSRSVVLRDGAPVSMPPEMVVPGDVCVLSLGDVVPADGIVLSGQGLSMDESALTGETFPADKLPTAESTMDAAGLESSVYSGTHVVAGSGRMLILRTGESSSGRAGSPHGWRRTRRPRGSSSGSPRSACC